MDGCPLGLGLVEDKPTEFSCDFFCASDWRALQAAQATRPLYTFVQTPSSLSAKGAGHETMISALASLLMGYKTCR